MDRAQPGTLGAMYCDRAEEFKRVIPITMPHVLAMEPPLAFHCAGATCQSDTAMVRQYTRYVKDLPLNKDTPAALIEVTFQPGPPGLDIDSQGIVNRIHLGSQAQKMGVQVGWRFQRVDADTYYQEVLDRRVASGNPYTVTFRGSS